jgi:hypothetical protein
MSVVDNLLISKLVGWIPSAGYPLCLLLIIGSNNSLNNS